MEAIKETSLQVVKSDQNVMAVTGYQTDLKAGQIAQIKSCVSFEKGHERELSKEEIQKIWYIIQVRRLDPDTRQIYFICDRNNKINCFNSIDGLRLTAQRSGAYKGQEGPYFCGQDGVWKDVWLSHERPLASKVGVYRQGFERPVWGIALFSEYGKQFGPWKQYPTVMLAKVAESLALRKAFPEELSGVYAEEEQWMQTEKKEENKSGENQNKKIDVIETVSTQKDEMIKRGRDLWAKIMKISPEVSKHLYESYKDMVIKISFLEMEKITLFVSDLEILAECKTGDEYFKVIEYWGQCELEQQSVGF